MRPACRTFWTASPLTHESSALSQAPAAPAKPHILFLLGDEVGWNNVGWHNPEALTPNLDLLAKGGIILNNSYVQRWCAPTRAAFMSGRYAYNTGTSRQGRCGHLRLVLLCLYRSGRRDGPQSMEPIACAAMSE